MILCMISSSSAFRRCAELVALVNGCFGGGVAARGGGREKGAADRAGASKIDHGSEGLGVCGV